MARAPRAIYAFPDAVDLGRGLARALRVPGRAVRVHRFPDGESLVRVAGCAATRAILVRRLHDPNPKLLEVLLAADALRRAGARRVTLVAPYLPYMRQDRVFAAGEPVSARVLAGQLGAAFDEVVTVEAHLHRIRRLADVFACRAHSLPAASLLGRFCRRLGRAALLVGPDAESAPWVRAVARAAGLRFVVAHKERLSDRRVRVHLPELPRASRAVLVDDIASSGATLAAAARALRQRGLDRVDAIVVHAIFAPRALARLRAAGVRRIVSCDTVPHRTNALGVAPLLAAALGGRHRMV